MDDIIWPPKTKARRSKTHKKLVETKVEHTADVVEDLAIEPSSVMADESSSETPETPAEAEAEPKPEPPKKPHWWQLKRRQLSKKQWSMLIAGLIVLLWAGGVGFYYTYHHFRRDSLAASTLAIKHRPKPAATPTMVPSSLTGLPVDPAANGRQVTAIMIENSPDARPQSGLLNAGIVYEAIAEGGITRFMALYQAEMPDYIGPVRSVRPYYLDFLMPFHAAVAHVGGAPQALIDIKTFNVKDLDEFYNGSSYTRITSRYAPHNVYTSMTNLNALEVAKGFTGSPFVSFPRKKDAPSKQPNATSIDFAISGYLYNVHYDYDAAANSYKRSEGGQPHTDEKSGTQLEPKVVMALVMNRGIDADGDHTDYTDTGSGPLYLFQDGIVTQGTWHKADRTSQFSFTDTAGKTLPLNAGQTWISIVDAGTVTYK